MVWKKLTAFFVLDLQNKISNRVQQWEDFRMSPSKTANAFILRTQRLLVLAIIGYTRSDAAIIEKIYRTIPSSFESWAKIETPSMQR
jgi:N-acetylneuraminic acid mutarotase